MFCRLNMWLPSSFEVDSVDTFQAGVIRGDDALSCGEAAEDLHLFGIAPTRLDPAPLGAVPIRLQHEGPVSAAAFEKGPGRQHQARNVGPEGQPSLQGLPT